MTIKKTLLAAAITGSVLATGTAQATNGYFSHGYGVKSKGMAGGGVAFANDSAMIIATNPAGITDVQNQFTIEGAWFKPMRSYDFKTNFGPGMVMTGSTDSQREDFFIPAMAGSYALTDKDSIGIAVYGNGGMNTNYPKTADNFIYNPQGGPGPQSGVFGGGETGVDLMQLFIAPTYAHAFLDGRLSLGITPIIAWQRFRAEGLGPFAGFSVDPTSLTNNEHDKAWGYGGKIGVTFKATDRITLGASYQSEIDMDEFDDYSGLFAGGGDFDIPSTYTAGLAAAVTDRVTVTFDYQRINYSDIESIANPSLDYLFAGKLLGSSNGAGFGWDDIDVYKLGVQWQATPQLQLRAGWSHGDHPISSNDALFNALTPALIKDHITAGFSYAFNERHELHGSFMYAPEEDLSGKNAMLAAGGVDQDVQIQMNQYEATVGYTYKF
jgi:long-chain fatty acid transport protein